MKITNFKPVMLDNADRLTDGKNPFTEVYSLNNGRIFKYLKPPCDNSLIYRLNYKSFYESFCRKLKKADDLQGEELLVLPDEVSVDDKGMVKGYFMDQVNLGTFDEHVRSQSSLSDISDSYDTLNAAVEQLHQKGIVIPDLITVSNVLYDKEKGRLKFIDYDGMQVGSIPTNAISKKLYHRDNSILRDRKYSRFGNLYTTNIDSFSVIDDYLLSVSGINMASLPLFQNIHSITDPEEKKRHYEEIKDFFISLGIVDQDVMESFTKPFITGEANPNPKRLIKDFSSRYKYVSQTDAERKQEIFVKKH